MTGPHQGGSRWRAGPLIEAWLKSNGRTQAWLAEATGYTVKHINQIVRGHATITAGAALALEVATGVAAEVWLTNQMDAELADLREKDKPDV